uniref:Genome polyprotein n=2 Tax=Rice tungro spherical virus TaxID=35287 RepID=Q1MNG4_9SECO|nr:polyprotein [Rice tungro spherical virus]
MQSFLLSSKNQAKLLHAGLEFVGGVRCAHQGWVSGKAVVFCNYCNFAHRLYRFYTKNHCVLNKETIENLCGRSFVSLYRAGLLLDDFTIDDLLGKGKYAKGSIDNLSIPFDDCALCPNAGTRLSQTGVSHDHFVCNYVEHLFECASFSRETGGKFFRACSEGWHWNATCTTCGASCRFANPRENIVIAIFMNFLRVMYDGNKYYVSLHCDTEWIPVHPLFARLVLMVRGFAPLDNSHVIEEDEMDICGHPSEVTYDDPSNYAFTHQHVTRGVGMGHLAFCRDANGVDRGEHKFYLHGPFDLKMTHAMFRVFMILLNCHGYVQSEFREEHPAVKDRSLCALLSVAGLRGVNIACNEEFIHLHSQFHNGSFRSQRPIPMVYAEPEMYPPLEYVRLTESWVPRGRVMIDDLPSLMSRVYAESSQPHAGEIYEEVFDEDDLFELGDDEGTSTRGLLDLGRRLGGLLLGATKCVKGLHAVIEWPVDVLTKEAEDLGTWLADNKKYVSESTWSCQVCPEVQDALEKSMREQAKLNAQMIGGIKKLATTMDSATSKLRDSLKELERRISVLEQGVDETQQARITNLENFCEDAAKAFEVLRADIDALKKKPAQSVTPLPSPSGNSGTAGEQRPPPRRRPPVVEMSEAQAGETVIVGGDEEQEAHRDSSVAASGPTDEHNAMLQKIYLGSFKWKVSDGGGSILKTFSLPSDIWAANDRMKNFLSYFQYYTCEGMTFTLTITSIGLHGGTLLVAWDALSSATRRGIVSMIQLSNLPSMTLHASGSSIGTLTVTSPAIQHQICTSGSEGSIANLGSLVISVANVLCADSASAQELNVNAWVQFDKPKLSYWTAQHSIAQSGGFEESQDLGDLQAIIATGKWSTTSDKNLMEIIVHPTACYVSEKLIYQTNLSVVAHMFAKWSGSMKYTFVFGASLFDRGKIMVSAVPVQFRNSKLTLSQMAAFPSMVCDLSVDTREFTFEVPYISIGKMSLVCKDYLFDISSYNADLVVSRLHVMILDPLVKTGNASNSIGFYVVAGPGRDFKLHQMCGVKSQFAHDVLTAQDFGRSLTCSRLLGKGFKEWCSRESLLMRVPLKNGKKRAFKYAVTPRMRTLPPEATSLSWLSQIFVEWRGSLTYTIHVQSGSAIQHSYMRIWYDPNGKTDEKEVKFLDSAHPPAGIKVYHWDLKIGDCFRFTVPYCARTEKLQIPKAYASTPYEWLTMYNGAVTFDSRSGADMELFVSIAGGDDFEMFEQTVPPKCGSVSDSYTVLSYADDVKSVTEVPNKTTYLADEQPTTSAPRMSTVDTDEDPPTEGEIARTSNGTLVQYRGGAWKPMVERAPTMSKKQVGPELEVSDPHMYKCIKNMNKNVKVLTDRQCTAKLADIVDSAQELVGSNSTFVEDLAVGAKQIRKFGESLDVFEGSMSAAKTAELIDNTHAAFSGPADGSPISNVVQLLLPMLSSIKGMSGKMESKMASLTAMFQPCKKAITHLIERSFPYLACKGFKTDKWIWAALASILVGAALLHYYRSDLKFVKKWSVMCMIIWAPLLAEKAYHLGTWIKEKFLKSLPRTRTIKDSCRKHSLAGAFECLASASCAYIKDNWAKTMSSLLTILSVVASLVMWGKIPDDKEITNFADKFHSIGKKGRSITNIIGGFEKITSVCKKWSETLVGWIVSNVSGSIPKEDLAMTAYLGFKIHDWVRETRDMALMENRFQGFGGDEHLVRVRRLYGHSLKIDNALMEKQIVPDMQLSLIIKECRQKCLELMNESYTYKGMKQSRIDPLHVCMLGAPGVGKSTIAHVVINNLLDHRGEPEVDRIYTRCCADAYWSNYHQEPVILYDDLGAIKSNLRLSDYAEIMGIKTNDPFSVPMAAVEDKGKHCTSKYVFSCTNVLNLDDTGDVVTKMAYYRRRNVLVKVERDPDVPKNEANPTEGLVFTVLGHDQNCQGDPQFVVKENWDEPFLREVDTEGWRFERVEYRTFLRFLCMYTDAYMYSQEQVLQGIKTFKMNPFAPEPEFAQAQSGEAAECEIVEETQEVPGEAPQEAKGIAKIETAPNMDELVEAFNKLRVTPGHLNEILRDGSGCYIDEWAIAGPRWLSFHELLPFTCGCHHTRVCDFNIVYNNMCKAVRNQSVHFKYRANQAIKYAYTHKLHSQCRYSIDFEKLRECNPLDVFVCVLSKYTADDHSFERRCPKKMNVVRMQRPPVFELKMRPPSDSVVAEDDRGQRVFEWPHLYTFLRYRAIEFKDDKGSLTVREDASADVCPWNEFLKLPWLDGDQLKSVLPAHLHRMVQARLEQVEIMEENGNYSGEMKNAIAEIKEYLDQDHQWVAALVLVACAVKERRRMTHDKLHRKSFNALDKLDKWYTTTAPKTSKKMKILLAIGASVAVAGVAVGAVILLQKTNLFGSKEDEEIEGEEGETQASGAHESDGIVTQHLKRDIRPKMRVTYTDHHVAEAHEEKGAEKSRKPGNPARKSYLGLSPGFAERGMGVTYEEHTPLKDALLDESNKVFRRKIVASVESAVKQGGKASKDSVLSQISEWQDKVKATGVIAARQLEASGSLKKIHNLNSRRTSSHVMPGLVVHDGTFERSDEVDAELHRITIDEVKSCPKMIKEGVSTLSVKKASVGMLALQKAESQLSFPFTSRAGVDRDLSMTNLIDTHMAGMSCIIISELGNVFRTFGVLRLCGTYVCMPAHYLDEITSEHTLYFVCPSKITQIQLERHRVCLVNGFQETVVWDLGPSVPPSRNYIDFIANADDWKNYKATSGALVMSKYSVDSMLQCVHFLDSIELTEANVSVPTSYYEANGGIHTIISGLRYRVHCMPGFCGAAIMRADATCFRKIIGMHVSGLRNKCMGYAETLTQEHLMQAIETLKKTGLMKHIPRGAIGAGEEKLPEHSKKQSLSLDGKGNLGIVGQLPAQLVPTSVTKTTICKSMIHGLIGEIKTEPSVLSAWDRRLPFPPGEWDPMKDAVKKYGSYILPFPTEEIQEVENFLIKKFKRKENSRRTRNVNSLEVGINGIDGSDFWSPIEMKTSPGYPYILKRPSGAQGKKYLFEELEPYPSGRPKYAMKDPELIESYERIKEEVTSGVKPSIMTMECLKDERRKLAKIYEKPATRTFTILSPEVNILFRQYFGDFAAMVMSTRREHFSQVGINPESMEWSDLINSLLRVNTKGFAGDYSKFDGIGSPAIYHSIVNVVDAWYDDGEVNARARHSLISSIVHRDGICGDLILRYSQGMPSGFAMTVIFNSFVNYYFMALAWMSTVGSSLLSPQGSCKDFDTYCKIVAYGDDNVVSVHEEFLDVYNLQTVAAYLSHFGVTYTDGDKNPIHMSKPYEDITKMSFLKRGFERVESSGFLWKAPLDKTSIEERLNWIRDCPTPVEALEQNIESALHEAAIHGRDYFDDLVQRLNSALRRVMLPPTDITFEECQARWWASVTGDALRAADYTSLVKRASSGHVEFNKKYRDMFRQQDLPLKEILIKSKPVALLDLEV